MTTYEVRAKRWAHGWELHISDGGTDIGVTQSRTLADAERMVRDYIETLLDIDVSGAEVVVTPELGTLGQRARRARERVQAAEQARHDAGREARTVVRELRAEGLSVTDTAAVLGVSRGRVSQLVKEDA